MLYGWAVADFDVHDTIQTSNAKTYCDLPKPARDYVEYIENFAGVKVRLNEYANDMIGAATLCRSSGSTSTPTVMQRSSVSKEAEADKNNMALSSGK